jgi:F-type H+-transporting ATPase subunit a
MSIFLFTLFCCLTGLVPFLDESTNDLNTTLALGLTSFIYIQIQKIKSNGFIKYLKEFADPIALLLPLNIIGELAKIASMSFRLFGNILGGGIIFSMVISFIDSQAKLLFIFFGLTILGLILFSKLVPAWLKNKLIEKSFNYLVIAAFFVTWLQLFFGIFEGVIQSFVLTMLTITYLSMSTSSSKEQRTLEELS